VLQGQDVGVLDLGLGVNLLFHAYKIFFFAAKVKFAVAVVMGKY